MFNDERERKIFRDPEGPARVPLAADHRGGKGLRGGHIETVERDRIRNPGRHAVSVAEQDAPRRAPGLRMEGIRGRAAPQILRAYREGPGAAARNAGVLEQDQRDGEKSRTKIKR